jgi:glycosyltransferase involved in cell wall biosynthesis
MDISIIIPTFGRGTKLAQCLRALAAQTMDQSRFEVLVGLDGPDEQAALMAADVWTGERDESLQVVACPREGYNATRNRLLPLARGRIMVSLNDDVIPVPTFLEAHLHAHDDAAARGVSAAAGGVEGAGVIISGYSPWRRFDNDTLFDRLIRETSMIFFYDQMFEDGGELGMEGRTAEGMEGGEGSEGGRKPKEGRDHDWGFRHCWGMNFSAPLDAVREVGGFIAVPLAYGYDDIEIAFRLRARYGMPVLFRPEARAVHDHRYRPREVLDREHRLGRSAWHFAGLRPEFGLAVFGRDVRSEAEVRYSREFVAREAGAAARIEARFLSMTDIPASVVNGPYARELVEIAYQQHLLLKRWTWRKGLLEAADEAQ